MGARIPAAAWLVPLVSFSFFAATITAHIRQSQAAAGQLTYSHEDPMSAEFLYTDRSETITLAEILSRLVRIQDSIYLLDRRLDRMETAIGELHNAIAPAPVPVPHDNKPWETQAP
jgi:hypothetical protein